MYLSVSMLRAHTQPACIGSVPVDTPNFLSVFADRNVEFTGNLRPRDKLKAKQSMLLECGPVSRSTQLHKRWDTTDKVCIQLRKRVMLNPRGTVHGTLLSVSGSLKSV